MSFFLFLDMLEITERVGVYLCVSKGPQKNSRDVHGMCYIMRNQWVHYLVRKLLACYFALFYLFEVTAAGQLRRGAYHVN